MGYGMQGAYSSKGPYQGKKLGGGYTQGQMPNFTPEMMEFFSSLMDQLGEGSFLSRLANGDDSLTQEMEQGNMKEFNDLQGQMGSRFSGMGMGAQKGSGFKNAQNQASSDFASKLQGDRSAMRMNAIKELQGMGNNLLQQKPYENVAIAPGKPWWETSIETLGKGAMAYFGAS